MFNPINALVNTSNNFYQLHTAEKLITMSKVTAVVACSAIFAGLFLNPMAVGATIFIVSHAAFFYFTPDAHKKSKPSFTIGPPLISPGMANHIQRMWAEDPNLDVNNAMKIAISAQRKLQQQSSY